MKKTFSYKGNKVAVKAISLNSYSVVCSDRERTYRPMVANGIEEVKQIAHEMADNNDIGTVLSTKIHDWFYGEE